MHKTHSRSKGEFVLLVPICKPYFEDITLSLEEIVNFGPKDDQMTPNIFNVLTENKATSIFC